MKDMLDRFAQNFAHKLFLLMPEFDKFDCIIHRIEQLIAQLDRDDVKYVMKYYDLVELLGRVKHYKNILENIEKRLEELLY